MELTSADVIRGVFAAVGLLIAGLAVPLMWRRVPPNNLYGLRVPATLADEWVWYEANARSGRWLCALGLLTAVLALVLPLVIPTGTVVLVILIFVLVVGVTGGAMWGDQVATQLLKDRQLGGRGPDASRTREGRKA